MVTIIDVARCAGVSKSTVSLVLNKNPRVKEETRLRVEEAIKTLGYVCNSNARGLRKKETKCLGVVNIVESKDTRTYEFNSETGQFSYGIVNGISAGLEDTDYGMIVERFSRERAISGELPQIIAANRVDGVFLVGGLFTDEVIERIRHFGIPMISVGHRYDMIDSVYADVERGMELQVEELMACGCRCLAMINGSPVYESSRERLEGWNQALAQCSTVPEQIWQIHCHRNTGEGGYMAMKKLWEEGIRPDGVAAANEPIAMGVRRFLLEQGVRIPEDVSVRGYEASVLGGYAAPALTSVNVYKEQMGVMAAGMLIKRIENPAIERQTYKMAPELLRRGSVKSR